ncbi:MAG TPA: pseudouridine-5'-phosphate glycosidase [Gemmataceae bacterium]|nr:pseudouridine-5'-phosphate glycosidase [Gemmataceae bacterium]
MLVIRPDIETAVREGRPVVALESTLIAHGLPWPINIETAKAAEAAITLAGALPATIAVLRGQPTIGLTDDELDWLTRQPDVMKAGRRDLAVAIAQQLTAGTTVAGTVALAQRAGIRVFATGGIGGAHREPWDISADMTELARTPVAVICAGAKSILDLPRTLELLETLSVPVLGYGTDTFPAFYLRTSNEPVTARVDTPEEVAAVLHAHWHLGGAGVIVAQPVAADVAVDPAEWEKALWQAEKLAAAKGIRGKAVTPFLLARVAEITEGKTLRANQALIVANARLAGLVANALR